ncbi:MAG: SEC59/DGK1/VTE5 family protein [Bacteroidota bacterium]|nr:SEC59/DGK1/VTE5 family protein [Bacteroidota bacterium]
MSTPAADSPAHVSFEFELMRKGIHMLSLSIPIGYYFMSRELALTILVPLTLLFVFGDVLRTYHEGSYRLYHRIFGRMLRAHEKTREKKTLNGASWVLISATLCVLVFPKLIAITAFAILIVSDTVAALVGRRFGTRKFNDKTLEGSTAFVVSAAIVILLTPKIAHAPVEYLIAFVAAVFGALAEVFSFDIIDDNFAIPLAIGSTLWLMYVLFLPEMNVYLLDG